MLCCVAATALPSTIQLINNTCFGAKGDVFATFTIPYDMPVATITAHANPSMGVRCDRTSAYSSFLCRDQISIGLACLPPQQAALRLLAFNDSSASRMSATVTLSVGLVLAKNMRCAIVYLEDFLDRQESDNSGESCVCVNATLHAVQGTESPFALFPEIQSTDNAWLWDPATTVPTAAADLSTAVMIVQSVTNYPRAIAASLTPSEMPSVFVPDAHSMFIKVSIPMESIQPSLPATLQKCHLACDAAGLLVNGSAVSLPIVTSQTVNDVLAGFLANETQRSARISNMSSTDGFSSMGRPDLYLHGNGSWSTSPALPATSYFVLCQVQFPTPDKTKVITVYPGCEALKNAPLCAENPFCSWVADTGSCCRRAERTPSGRCHCSQPTSVKTTVAQFTNPTCNVMSSRLNLRNLIAQACDGLTDSGQSAACRSDYARCVTPEFDIVSLLDATMSLSCETSSFTNCMDHSLQCTRHSIPPPQTNDPNSTIAGLLVPNITLNNTEINVEQIWSGNATLRLMIPEEFSWNSTAVKLADIAGLHVFFEAAEYSKNGWVASVVQSNAATVISENVLSVRLGPYCSILPETWQQKVKLTLPASLFLPVPPQAPATVVFTVVRPYRGDSIAKFTKVASLISTAAGLASGAGGWIGLATTQSLMMMSHIGCAEATVRRLFPHGRLIVTPLRYLDESFRFIYTVTIVGLTGLFLVHLALVPLSGEVVWKDKMRSIWFPYVFMYLTIVFLQALTEAAYTGLIDDHTPYVRVIFFLTDALFSGFFAVVWNYGLRNGYEGYFERYYGPSGLQTASALTQARFGGLLIVFRESLRESIRSGEWREDLPRYAKRFVLPCGHWPLARGFAVIREQCHDRGCYFAFVTAVFFFCAGVDAAHNSDDTGYCYAVYSNYTALLAIHVALFLIYLPFRIPLLNFLFFAERVLELALYASAARWVISNDPAERDGAELAYLAAATCGIQTAISVFVCAVVWIEKFVWARNQCSANGDETVTETESQEMTAQSLDLPLLSMQPELLPTETEAQDVQKEVQRMDEMPEDQRRSRLIEFHPVPAGWSAEQMLMLLNTLGSVECELVGSTAFVWMQTPHQARAAVFSFNGRICHGNYVKCRLVYDSMFDKPSHPEKETNETRKSEKFDRARLL